MVTALIIVVLVDGFIFILFVIVYSLIFFGVIVLGFKSAHSFVLTRLPFTSLSEAILCLSHGILVTEDGVVVISIVVKNLFFFGFLLLVLELVNYFLLFLSPLRVLQVIQV